MYMLLAKNVLILAVIVIQVGPWQRQEWFRGVGQERGGWTAEVIVLALALVVVLVIVAIVHRDTAFPACLTPAANAPSATVIIIPFRLGISQDGGRFALFGIQFSPLKVGNIRFQILVPQFLGISQECRRRLDCPPQEQHKKHKKNTTTRNTTRTTQSGNKQV